MVGNERRHGGYTYGPLTHLLVSIQLDTDESIDTAVVSFPISQHG
jgi:hypothetical protein